MNRSSFIQSLLAIPAAIFGISKEKSFPVVAVYPGQERWIVCISNVGPQYEPYFDNQKLQPYKGDELELPKGSSAYSMTITGHRYITHLKPW